LLFAGVSVAQEHPSGASVARGAATEVHEEVHDDPAAAGEQHEEQTVFGIPAWILKLINLLLFVGLLVYFLGRPIRNAFRDRREKIRRELADAAERRAKADRLAADIQARLDQIEREVGAILERAEQEGERQKQEMIAQAEADAAKILAQARNAVDAQLKHARAELTAYAGQLASERALSMLETQMTEADRKKIFTEGLEEIRK
ncbi:MAG: F0F1 ATP synthase subunit B, partial [Thermoanaerobaculia bacterium]